MNKEQKKSAPFWGAVGLTTIIMLGLFGPTIVQWLHNIGEGVISLSSGYGKQNILNYFGTILSAIGTFFLGFIVLMQNQQIKKESDKTEKELRGHIKIISETNSKIASINDGLLSLSKDSNWIQLLLAQKYVPFYEFNYIKIISSQAITPPKENLFNIVTSGTDRFDPVEYSSGATCYLNVEIIELTTLSDYHAVRFDINLSNISSGVVEAIDIDHLRFFNNGTLSKTFSKKSLSQTISKPIKVMRSNNLQLAFEVVCSDDNKNLFGSNLEISVQITTTTGLRFLELLTITGIEENPPLTNYEFEALKS